MKFNKHVFNLAKAVPSALQQDLLGVTTPKTQKEKILYRLREAGPVGVTNVELNGICFRYAARIHDLKQDGHNIRSVKINGSMWVFVLEDK